MCIRDRMELRFVAKMRFANPGRRVTRSFQAVSRRLLRDVETHLRASRRRRAGIEFVPEALLIPSREQRRARRTAIRSRDISASESHTGLRDGINVRRGNLARVS